VILYCNINADSPARGLVFSETKPVHIDAPSFVVGDVIQVYIYLVDGSGAFSDIGGEPASSIKVALGQLPNAPVAFQSSWSQVQYGWLGFLYLNSLDAINLVGSNDFIDAVLEIELTRGAGTISTLVQQRTELRKELITGNPVVSNPEEQYFNKDEALARFVHNRSEITQLTGGTLNSLDGIATTTLPLGVLAAVTFGDVVQFYQLLNSVTPPNPPWYVRPVDYNAGTSKVWKLIATDVKGHTHLQVSPASVWSGSHNFGFKPSGFSVIVGGEIVLPTISVDDNNYTVNFSANFAGEARMR
jgi:hypothetical protein